jgi:CHAT domain-containing protein
MSSLIPSRSRLLFPLLAAIGLATLVLFQVTDYERRFASARERLSAWDLKEAEGQLQSLVADYPASLDARRLYAECLLKRGELHRARIEFTNLLRSDSSKVFSHTLSLAFAHFFLGHSDTAAALANTVLQSPLGAVQHGRAFNLLGRIAFNRARYDSAMTFQRRSLAIARERGDAQIEADALRQIGVLLWYHGKADSARLMYYKPALEIYRSINDRIGEATTLNNTALAGGTMRGYLEAFSIRKKIGDQIGLADSYYFVTGGELNHWFDLMYSFRKKSLELSRRIGYAWGEQVAARAVEDMVVAAYDSVRFDPQVVDATAAVSGEQTIQRMLRQSSELFRMGRMRESADLRGRIVVMCDSMGYTIGLEQALGLHLLALIPLGEHAKAEAVARRLQTLWSSGSIEARSFLARVYLAEGRTREASQLLWSLIGQFDADYLARLKQRDISFSLVSGSLLMLRYELYSMLMTTFKAQRDTKEMFSALERFRSLPLGFSVEAGNANAAGGDESIWHRYVRLLEEIHNGSDDVERLLAEFDDAYLETTDRNSEAVHASQQLFGKHIPDMRRVQRALGDDQVLVEYFVGKERTYMLALRRDSSFSMELSEPSSNVNSSVRTLRELLLRGKTVPHDALWKGPASFLFHTLMQPIVDRGFLNKGDHLIILPNGRLHEIPFATLLDSNGTLLVQQYVLSYLASASQILNMPKEISLSTFLGLVPNSASLPFAEAEVAAIPATLFSSEVVLRDGQATIPALMDRAAASDVIHIATHGSMHQWHPLFSYFQMHDGPFELHRILNLRLTSRLIVLSSCETGYGVGMMGDISRGHEVVSFPQAFLSAGASAVIAPLWVVEDEATSRLMASFYTNLASMRRSGRLLPPGSFSRALTRAQRNLAGEHGHTHPFFWAGFYVTGSTN